MVLTIFKAIMFIIYTHIKMPHSWKSHVTAHLIHFEPFEMNDEVRGMFAKVIKNLNVTYPLSRGMSFPKMWYVRPAKPQISLRIRAV